MAKGLVGMSLFFVVFALMGITEMVMATTKDGFNIYKDLLRGKGEEDDVAELVDDGRGSKVSYFYRTPAQVGLNFRGGPNPADFGKRTINRFKNYMLGKDSQSEEDFQKRGPGALFGWALSNRQNMERERHSFDGMNRNNVYGENN